MSYVDTEMEREDTGLIGSYKITVKLQEIHVDSFGPGIMYLPRPQSTHCTYTACISFNHSLQNITGSDGSVRLFSCDVEQIMFSMLTISVWHVKHVNIC